MQNRSLAVILMISTLLPVLAVAWLSMQLLSDSEATAHNQHQALLQLKLDAIQNQMLQRFSHYELNLLKQNNDLEADTDSVRTLINNTASIKHILILNTQGEIQFPARHSQNTQDQALFERLQISLETGDLLNAATAVDDSKASYMSRAGAQGTQTTTRNGWYTWHWGQALRHALWVERDGLLRIFELDPQHLRADLIGEMPDTGRDDTEQFALFDERGDILYQWGAVDENWQKLGGLTLERALPAPLASWRLQYTGPGPGQLASQKLLYAAMLLGLFALLASIATWVYREQTRAARLSRQRVSFVNQVSHELKTPLTNVRLYAELAEHSLEDEDDHPAQNYLRVINEESERLTRLVNNVLSYAREQRGKIELHCELLSPDELVRSVIDAFRPQLTKREIELSVSLNASDQGFYDREVIEQVLGNLLSNAEKYAASGKKIDVHTDVQDNTLLINVRDFGPGIVNSMHETIFIAFERLSDRSTEGSSGTGIGLHIARSLCELHGGDISVSNAEPGAQFTARIKAGGGHTE